MSSLFDLIAFSLAGATFFALLAGFWWVRSTRARRAAELEHRVIDGALLQADSAIIQRGDAEKQPAALQQLIVDAGLLCPQRVFLLRSSGIVVTASTLAWLATGSVVAAFLISALAVLSFILYLVVRRDRRVAAVQTELPRALEMMMFSLRAGQSLEESVRVASEEIDGPLAEELARCHQETLLGRPIDAALNQVRQRWAGAGGLQTFAEAVIVLKRTGGNLVEVLERIAETLRGQATYEAKYRAVTAESRMSGLILIALPLFGVAVQCLVAADQIAAVARVGAGKVIIALALGLWLAGAAWVMRLIRPPRGRI